MIAPLRSVVVKRPEDAFRSQAMIENEWRRLNYIRPPDFDRACLEHQALVPLLGDAGATVLSLPVDDRTGLDSLYTHDPVLITDQGALIFQTGKPARRGEGPAFADALRSWGVPILGTMTGNATAEAGDMIWLDHETLLVGRSFRTNDGGIEAVTSWLKPLGVRVISFELPWWKGPDDVLHLMSFISLLDEDLAIVYRRLLPVSLFEFLSERRVQLVDVPEEEFDTLGCNVLALSPRNVMMVSGNPVTRGRLEAAGCSVHEFHGKEICLAGSGGPTCLTRPLLRG